jgi:uncharacterized protein
MKNSIRNKLSSKFHLIKGGATYLLFNVDNLSLFKIDYFTYEVFSKILEGYKIEDILEEYGIDNFREICKEIFKNTDGPINHKSNTSKIVLERLVLNVSNACNLNCRYCYAVNGSYGEEKSFMGEKVAIRTIDYFYNLYDEINTIQFFGGEPLLNPEIIQTVCTHILNNYNNKAISKLPIFATVTNGTIMSPEILEILSDYKIQVTVSIDGPQFIHDPLRGEGTFKKIIKNIEYLKSKDIDIAIECTFTNYHLINGFDVSDLMEFFYEQLGLHETHIPPVAVPPKDNELYIDTNDLIKSYTKAIKFALDCLNKEDYKLESFTLRLLKAIVFKKKIAVYCPAGISTLSVSSEGDIYPCFMFTGNKEFLIGNVFENKISSVRLSKMSELLKEISKWNDPKCRSCWARSLCFGCIGNDYIFSGSIRNKPHCDFNKKIIEFFLLNSCEILDDPIIISRIMSLREPIDSSLKK